MQPTLIEMDRNDLSIERITRAGKIVFGDEYSESLVRSNWINSHPKTKFYGFFVGEELVSTVAFIAHAAEIDRRAILLYQACHVITLPEHQGKGYFSKIVAHAIAHLDGEFIIGFPNTVAEPIWVKKLAFHLEPLRRIWAPVFVSSRIFNSRIYAAECNNPFLVRVDERAISEWKKLEHPNQIESFEENGNYIWGREILKRIGFMSVRVFLVGGISMREPSALSQFLKSFFARRRVKFVQFICAKNSPISRSARVSLHGDRTEPLIWLPLRPERLDMSSIKFDLHNSIKDVA
jgi:GNAT superfamily N-acetyltransferase